MIPCVLISIMWGLILIPVQIDFGSDGIDFDYMELIMLLVRINSGVWWFDYIVRTNDYKWFMIDYDGRDIDSRHNSKFGN